MQIWIVLDSTYSVSYNLLAMGIQEISGVRGKAHGLKEVGIIKAEPERDLSGELVAELRNNPSVFYAGQVTDQHILYRAPSKIEKLFRSQWGNETYREFGGLASVNLVSNTNIYIAPSDEFAQGTNVEEDWLYSSDIINRLISSSPVKTNPSHITFSSPVVDHNPDPYLTREQYLGYSYGELEYYELLGQVHNQTVTTNRTESIVISDPSALKGVEIPLQGNEVISNVSDQLTGYLRSTKIVICPDPQLAELLAFYKNLTPEMITDDLGREFLARCDEKINKLYDYVDMGYGPTEDKYIQRHWAWFPKALSLIKYYSKDHASSSDSFFF